MRHRRPLIGHRFAFAPGLALLLLLGACPDPTVPPADDDDITDDDDAGDDDAGDDDVAGDDDIGDDDAGDDDLGDDDSSALSDEQLSLEMHLAAFVDNVYPDGELSFAVTWFDEIDGSIDVADIALQISSTLSVLDAPIVDASQTPAVGFVTYGTNGAAAFATDVVGPRLSPGTQVFVVDWTLSGDTVTNYAIVAPGLHPAGDHDSILEGVTMAYRTPAPLASLVQVGGTLNDGFGQTMATWSAELDCQADSCSSVTAAEDNHPACSAWLSETTACDAALEACVAEVVVSMSCGGAAPTLVGDRYALGAGAHGFLVVDGLFQASHACDCVQGLDQDGDGYASSDGDCDDSDAAVYPGAPEGCDDRDSDCDGGLVDEFPDGDGDGTPDCADDDIDGDGYDAGADCDDTDATVFPGAIEACDAVDSDCNGSIADGFADADGDDLPDCADDDADGDGVATPLDCDDTDPGAFPGAPESCDGVDSNCDGSLLDGFPDFDGDGDPDCFDSDDDNDGDPDVTDCNDADASVFTGAAEACDGIDSDCDGDLNDGNDDTDGDGIPDCNDDDDDGDGSLDGDDCAPQNPDVRPGADEFCDGIDSDCDGSLVDEFDDVDGDGTPDCTDDDDDGDGSLDGDDCAPLDATAYPGAPELCDAADSDCDGSIVDEFPDFDGDLSPDCVDDDDDADGDPDVTDCGDLDPAVYAGAPESCDGVDSDCDGSLADEFDDLDGDDQPDCVDPDIDGDGEPGTTDCDDTDASVYTGAPELCDLVDSDCDGSAIDGYPNLDGDLLPNCVDDDADGDGEDNGTDCDDLNSTIYTGAPEACDLVDSDCDGDLVDGGPNLDGDLLPNCVDDDADGDGEDNGTDCDDLDPGVYTGAPESCDAVDSDCDGDLVDGETDSDVDGIPDCVDTDDDGDGDPDASDCAPNDPTRYHGAAESCDAIDTDCDGSLVDEFLDTDGDAEPNCIDEDDDNDGDPDVTDCDDTNQMISNGAAEACDSVDSDCDGSLVDEFANQDGDALPDCVDTDDDGDGFDAIANGGPDCNDGDPSIFPGAAEACDGIDQNCNGSLVDGYANWDGDSEPDCIDADDDNDGDPDAADCNDTNAAVFHGANEGCDFVDSDCDGSLVDEYPDFDTDGQPDCVDTDDDNDGDLDSSDCADYDDSRYHGAAETCDGIDQDCTGVSDDGNPAVMCPATTNVASTRCTGGSCYVDQCNGGTYDFVGGLSNGCECVDDTATGSTCGSAVAYGSFNVSNSDIVTGKIPLAGMSDWFRVDFPSTGRGPSNGGPAISLTQNPNSAFRLDVRTNCSGAGTACGLNEAPSALTSWEFEDDASYGLNAYSGGHTATWPSTVYVRVYRVTGGNDCSSYEVTISRP